MASKKQELLFPPEYVGATGPKRVLLGRPQHPVWTQNKARLIARYLRYFVLVTKHGTYIDGFAGPQESESDDMWSAKLVLESQPRWLRHFHLSDDNPNQVARLEALRAAQPPRRKKEPRRTVDIHPGDFNVVVMERLIGPRTIKERDATFCLLDQRTFECHWRTVQELAAYKTSGHKIELFYFLANHWLLRAMSGIRDTAILENWWGRNDWRNLQKMKGPERAGLFARRFEEDLGYAHVHAWPIYGRETGGHVMYYMLHASDHPEAPPLMRRAYEKAVLPPEPMEQLTLEKLLQPTTSPGEAEK